MDLESTPPRYDVCEFSDKTDIFHLNSGESIVFNTSFMTFLIKLLNFTGPLKRWDLTSSRPMSLLGGSLFFTTKFFEIPGPHFINLGRMNG